MPRPTGPTITPVRAPPRLQASDAQPNIPPTPEAFSLPNAPQSTTSASGPIIGLPPGDPSTPETTPARALPRAQLNVPATPEALLLPNESQSTTPTGVPISSRLLPGDPSALETTSARALPRAQPPGAQPNVPATPKALPLPNESQSTTPVGVPVSRLPPGNPPAPETTPARTLPRAQPNVLATPETLPLQTVSSNIRQKRRKVRNPHKIVLDFSLSNSGLISTNSSFGSIGFASNENNQENSTSRNSTSGDSISGTIYKSGNQTAENRANIECKPVTKGPQGVKRPRLTPEEKEIRKQAKSAEREAIKLEAAEKRKLEKEIKKTEALAKKARDEEAKRREVAIKIEEKAKRNIENAAEKNQNLKCKAALDSTGGPSEKKKKKELNNPPAETPAKTTAETSAETPAEKADTANDQS